MKKIVLFSACALMALSLTFVSCSDDDDFGEAPKSGVGVITTDDGDRLLLSGISGWLSLSYDSDGNLTYFDGWDVYYNPFEFVNEYDKYYYSRESLQFSFNDKGYATKAVYKYEENDDGDTGTGDGTINASYDSDGHLTKMSGSFSEEWKEDGYNDKFTSTFSVNITWKNGNATEAKVEWSENGSEYGESYRSSENATYTFSYGNTENKYNQYIVALTFDYDDLSEYFDFGFLGYLGKGPDYLPSKLSIDEVYEDSDGDDDSYSYSYTYSYTLNSNGTIKTEKENNYTYTYSYTTLSDTRSTAPMTIVESLSEQDKSRHRSFASRLRERHNRHLEKKNAQ